MSAIARRRRDYRADCCVPRATSLALSDTWGSRPQTNPDSQFLKANRFKVTGCLDSNTVYQRYLLAVCSLRSFFFHFCCHFPVLLFSNDRDLSYIYGGNHWKKKRNLRMLLGKSWLFFEIRLCFCVLKIKNWFLRTWDFVFVEIEVCF